MLTIVLLTVSKDLVVDEGADNVQEALDSADGVISVGIVHTRHLEKSSEELVVAVATLEIHVHGLEVASSQVNCTSLNRNGSTVQRDFVLHSDRPAFELARLYLVNLGTPLVPLEGVKPLNPGSSKTVLSVEVNS